MLKIKVKVGTADGKSAQQKVRIQSSSTGSLNTGTKIRLRAYREPGLGYDSEASDREEDPYIEHQFILRMCQGEDLMYLKKAVEEKTIGNGADFSIRFKGKKK